MDRLTVGILIAITAVIMMHGLGGKSLAAERPAGHAATTTPGTAAPAPRSGRVLVLIMALEALRASPELLDRSKV